MYNNRAFVCFERYGGRLTQGFAFYNPAGDAIQVLGSPVTNPSRPGEEELTGAAANRCSTFKDMNVSLVDAPYAVSMGTDYLEFIAPGGGLSNELRFRQPVVRFVRITLTVRAATTTSAWGHLRIWLTS